MSKTNKSKVEKDLEVNSWRQHIIEGLLKALQIPDQIKEALKQDNVKSVLIEQLKFSPHQAQSLLALKQPIDEIERQPILDELNTLKEVELQLRRQLP